MLKIKALKKNHDRAEFDCGNDEINEYLRRTARQHLDKGMSRSFVIIDDDSPTKIIGYYTLAACDIHVEKLPEGAYLATLQDVPGLVAQGRTATEAIEIARDVARKLMEARAERQGNLKLKQIDDSFDYPLIVSA